MDMTSPKREIQKLDQLMAQSQELIQLFPEADNLKQLQNQLAQKRARQAQRIGRKRP